MARTASRPKPRRSDVQAAAPARVELPAHPTERIPCPDAVRALVRQFDEQIETYTSGDYSEAQLRIDFINPLLEALGWDVNNRNGYAEAYRDVVYEDAVRIAGHQKAPDYGFYIGGRAAASSARKFFLEAKKPSINLRVDTTPAKQLRRYAWTAGLPVSILTNFRQFLVFDTRIKPLDSDKATTAVILSFDFSELPARWHEIASVFARDAITRGSFDKFAEKSCKKRGALPVDEAFLEEIESWREDLADNIADRNPDLSQDDLNFAVQRTIDRIIFLRMCEDRGIEPVGSLNGLRNGDRIYERLGKLYDRADRRYNSGLFHFAPEPGRDEQPDTLTLTLDIGDIPLKKILKRLYESPYEFSVMPPEILGQVYERFLGKVIALKPKRGGGVKVEIEEKPEVRKAGGVYYTPAYIVEYIVKNTVGKLLEGKHPKQAAKIRVLDPACGSGSFLIGAYQFLLDWHLKWYLDNNPESHCKGKNPPLRRAMRRDVDAPPPSQGGGQGGGFSARILQRQRHRIPSDTVPAQGDSHQLDLRGGHRRPGGGGNEAVAPAQGAGRRERSHGAELSRAVPRARFARPWEEHQVRQLPDRARLLRG